jgi:hypothetical protein
VQCGSVFHAFLCRCKRRDVRKRHGSCSRENSVLLLCFLLGMELVGSELVGARRETDGSCLSTPFYYGRTACFLYADFGAYTV